MCLILCCKPLKAGRHGGQFLQTLWSDPRFPHGMPLAHVGRRRVTGKRAELLSKLQSVSRPVCRLAWQWRQFLIQVSMCTDRAHAWECACPLITFRLSSFHVVVPWKPGHFKRLWPGFYSHYLLTESLDLSLPPGLGEGTEDKRVRHEHRVWTQDWRWGRQGLVSGGLRRIAECCGMSWCHVLDILLQWEVWMAWRSCSFIVHLGSSWVVIYSQSSCIYADAEYCWMIWMNLWMSEESFHWMSFESLQVLNQRDSTCHSWMPFCLSISEIRFCPKGPLARRQPWSVAASRPWPRHLKSTSPSLTSICIRVRLALRAPKAWCVAGSAEWLNATACHDVMFSTSFDSDKFGWFGGPVVSSFISVQGELSNM